MPKRRFSAIDSPCGSDSRTGKRVGAMTGQQRVRLILRLITEGSDRLARQVCDRLDMDRGRGVGVNTNRAPSWVDLVRAARQEGLLSDGEGALLAACPATLAHAH